MPIPLLLLLLHLHLATPPSLASFPQLNDDVLGLVVFKSDLTDPDNHLASWNVDDNSPCSWSFIKCNPSNRVAELSLDGLGLSGKIGRGLQRLESLKTLSLSNNKFAGVLSDELLPIWSLENLNLSKNGFSGRIPAGFVDMRVLKFLDLSENWFKGEVPDALFSNCDALRQIDLSNNELEGSVPYSVFKCLSLNSLNLANNRFSNAIDFANGVFKLQRLRTLDLSNNMFSGIVPKGVSALHNLKEFKIQRNELSGLIPQDIGYCIHLQYLDLSSNQFRGQIPDSVQQLTSLSVLDLSENQLSGEFPQWITNLVRLENIDLSSNRITGVLPETMADLGLLKVLNLGDNLMSGNMVSLDYCYKLGVINLRNNQFNGSIPPALFDLGLDEIDLSRNQLTGTIPGGSSRVFESLKVMDLLSNKLSGAIPAEIGLFSSLRLLNLSCNGLEGASIPPEIGYFQNLTVLDLRNSGIGGEIPGDLCDSGGLNVLQLDGNSLTGSIPDEMGNCSSLRLLSLSHNNLIGPIPRRLSLLSKLEILKLESNELSGEIPMELGGLTNLLAVNISYNKLTGRLPLSNVFQTLDQTAIQGNLGICSPLLEGPCKLNMPKPLVMDPHAYGNQVDVRHPKPESTSTVKFGNRSFLSISAIVAISAAVLILMGVLMITLLNVSAKKKKEFVQAPLESTCSGSTRSGGSLTGKLILFDPKSSVQGYVAKPELMLNKEAEISTGVFGTVYKVALGVEERLVAIKKLVASNMLQFGGEEFDREVRILAKAKHPNLIPIKGYYWTPQLQLLVMDYAPNGSLQDKLRSRVSSSPPMSWPIRFKILVGTAKGLAHLHHSFQPPIIHYSLKPSNILLDTNYNPLLSDYELARLLTKVDKHVTVNRFQSALGYVAPELACQSMRVTEKCDVFGYGVLILELVTGKRPVEYGEDTVVILSDQVRGLLEEGNVLECLDSGMVEYPEEEVLPMLKLALVCTSQIPSSRPTMVEVVQILQVIKTPVPQRMDPF